MPERKGGGSWKILVLVLVLGVVAVAAAAFLFFRGRRGPNETARTQIASEGSPPAGSAAEPPPPLLPPGEAEEPAASSPSTAPPAAVAAPASTTTPPPRNTTTVVPPPPVAAPAIEAPPPLPERPAVSVGCEGVRDGCAALRFAIVEASRKRGLRVARPPRADVHLVLAIEEVEARQEEQFGTTFVVRTYAVEVQGDSPHFDEELIMAPQMVTFDARLGRDKLKEASRRIAAEVVDAVSDYWARQRGR